MKKIVYFFYTFLPIFVSLSLMYLLTIFAGGIVTFSVLIQNFIRGERIAYTSLVQMIVSVFTDQTLVTWISALYAAAGIVVFGFWYRKKFRADSTMSENPLRSFNPKILLALILLVPSLQIASGYLTSITGALFPGWLDYYQKLMDTAGFDGAPSVALILYAVILGPVEEELTFRGVTLAAAKRSLPFWAANIFQALLFGIFHQNMIQGIYAFFIGLFFGYVYQQTNSIYVSILLHMLFNTWGTFFSGGSFGGSAVSALSILATAILLIWFSMYLVKSGAGDLRTAENQASHKSNLQD